jgi:hypothetical protein
MDLFIYPLCPDQLSLPTQPPSQWVRGSFSGGGAWLWRDADHSPPSKAEVCVGAIRPLPLGVCMAVAYNALLSIGFFREGLTCPSPFKERTRHGILPAYWSHQLGSCLLCHVASLPHHAHYCVSVNILMGRDSSVSRDLLRSGQPSSIPGRVNTSRPSLGLTQPLTQWVQGTLSY